MPFVVPGIRRNEPLSDGAMLMLLRELRPGITTHGFRSTFRDWTAEMTHTQREVAEATLAHAVGDKVEAAYRRGDLLAKRRELMDAWAVFCGSASQQKGASKNKAPKRSARHRASVTAV